MKSVQTMCEELDVELNEIPDWNCCSASIGYASGSELPRLTLSARNIALSEEHNKDQEIVATCAACWLATREAAERLKEDETLFKEANQALAEAGLKLNNTTPIKHMAEVLVEDIGFDNIQAGVKKPLEGIKIAGYVGCQTNRPFGIHGESFENPVYLDKMIEAVGAESIPDYAPYARPTWRSTRTRSTRSTTPSSTSRWCTTATPLAGPFLYSTLSRHFTHAGPTTAIAVASSAFALPSASAVSRFCALSDPGGSFPGRRAGTAAGRCG